MTIWLDVTTILNWHRPAVGVVRVEAEVARFFLGRDGDIYQFCRFDNAHKRYHHVIREVVSRKLDDIANPINSLSNNQIVPKPLEESSHLSTEQAHGRFVSLPQSIFKLFRIIKKPFVGVTIAGWKSFYAIKYYWDSARSNTAVLFARTAGASLNVMTEFVHVGISHLFAKDDIYISIGMDWDCKDWDYLSSLRAALGLKTLLCCYDLIPIVTPGLTTARVAEMFPSYIAGLARCADKLMCISTSTKNDLDVFLRQSGQPLPNSEVFYLGTDIPLDSTGLSPSPHVKELIDGTSYIMLVSTIERRKGHDTVYRAYQRLVEQGVPDLPLLVFVGMPGWGVDDLLADIQRTKRVSKYIRFLSHVTDCELILLYRHSLFTVFPSIYEG